MIEEISMPKEEIDRLKAEVGELRELRVEKEELLNVLWQLLDDMGKAGLCVCPAAKKWALEIYNKISPEPHEEFVEESDIA